MADFGHLVVDDPITQQCPGCGAVETLIEDAAGLRDSLTRHIATRERRLSHPDIRFLRKRLGWSRGDAAIHFGVAPESISRWESGRLRMSPPAERLLRVCALLADPASPSANDTLPILATMAQRRARPVRYRASRDAGAWRIREERVEATPLPAPSS